MQDLDSGGPERRFPGNKAVVLRGTLDAIGPLHEVAADGHEKMNDQALQMGSVSLPIYAFRDKFSGLALHAIVVPNSRNKYLIAHAFLDMVKKYGGKSMCPFCTFARADDHTCSCTYTAYN